MLYRKIEKKIADWIHAKGKEALLLTGARQIGKTYLIREILKERGCDFVEFNLIEQPSLIPLFEAAKTNDIGSFLARLSVATSHKLEKGRTIIFFDEVQEYKDIVTAVKFLVDDGSFKYIMSGSLLGVELRNLRSAPVGYLSVLDMFPMDLEEFLVALKIKQEILDYLRECYDGKKEVDGFIHAYRQNTVRTQRMFSERSWLSLSPSGFPSALAASAGGMNSLYRAS